MMTRWAASKAAMRWAWERRAAGKRSHRYTSSCSITCHPTPTLSQPSCPTPPYHLGRPAGELKRGMPGLHDCQQSRAPLQENAKARSGR